MIAVDTSALMGIILAEPEADACIGALAREPLVLISVVTLAEAHIVALQRNVVAEMASLVEGLALEVVPVSPSAARRIAITYLRWGKGNHSAGFNIGDCFAYDVAKDNECPLLFVGDNFAQTDVDRVL